MSYLLLPKQMDGIKVGQVNLNCQTAARELNSQVAQGQNMKHLDLLVLLPVLPNSTRKMFWKSKTLRIYESLGHTLLHIHRH